MNEFFSVWVHGVLMNKPVTNKLHQKGSTLFTMAHIHRNSTSCKVNFTFSIQGLWWCGSEQCFHSPVRYFDDIVCELHALEGHGLPLHPCAGTINKSL